MAGFPVNLTQAQRAAPPRLKLKDTVLYSGTLYPYCFQNNCHIHSCIVSSSDTLHHLPFPNMVEPEIATKVPENDAVEQSAFPNDTVAQSGASIGVGLPSTFD